MISLLAEFGRSPHGERGLKFQAADHTFQPVLCWAFSPWTTNGQQTFSISSFYCGKEEVIEKEKSGFIEPQKTELTPHQRNSFERYSKDVQRRIISLLEMKQGVAYLNN